MIGRTLILGGGETDYSFAETYLEGQKFDSVVCADSGLAAAKKLGLDVSFLWVILTVWIKKFWQNIWRWDKHVKRVQSL